MAFDLVHQPTWFPRDRDQIKPAPRGKMSAVAADAGETLRDRIGPLKIVQQPAIKTLVLKRLWTARTSMGIELRV